MIIRVDGSKDYEKGDVRWFVKMHQLPDGNTRQEAVLQMLVYDESEEDLRWHDVDLFAQGKTRHIFETSMANASISHLKEKGP